MRNKIGSVLLGLLLGLGLVTLKAQIGGNGNGTVTINNSPGGSDTQVQFNDSDAFGGDSTFLWNKTAHKLTVHTFAATGVAGTYSLANSGFIIKNAAGTELLRLWSGDPDTANFNEGNLYLGYQAGLAQPSNNVDAGYENVGLGYQALLAITTGLNNTAVGFKAGIAMTTAEENVAVGHDALIAVTTGSDNSFVGISAGQFLTTGSGNVGIGDGAGPSHADAANTLALGSLVAVTASNRAVIGNSSVTDVYFGSETGAAKAHASGVQITGLTTPTNKPVCFDASGNLYAGTNTAGILSCP